MSAAEHLHLVIEEACHTCKSSFHFGPSILKISAVESREKKNSLQWTLGWDAEIVPGPVSIAAPLRPWRNNDTHARSTSRPIVQNAWTHGQTCSLNVSLGLETLEHMACFFLNFSITERGIGTAALCESWGTPFSRLDSRLEAAGRT
uniref:Uncharacterized protein n=1 Tax=Bionectria ochroleuca TaxID=29856 RepID=A0A8H7NFK4_BIOOC